MIEISQRAGLPIEVYAFIGSSPIRQFVEQWDVALIAKRSAEAIDVAVKAGLPVAYVTEDTTRSRPEVLTTLFRAAIDHGATRLVLSDTVGHATPDGVRNLVQFTRSVIAGTGAKVGIDWHGHNDRGLALENALWALEFGADRVHGTALGIGERVGNAAMELLLLNLRLLGQLPPERDLTKLVEYCETVARAVGWEIPLNYPLVGRDAFRTATGVHAAAIIKAMQKGDAWLADRIYSGVPAGMFGRQQEIAIGFMSGASNVNYWLRQRGIEPTETLVSAILEVAKGTRYLLSDDEVMAVVDRSGKAESLIPAVDRAMRALPSACALVVSFDVMARGVWLIFRAACDGRGGRPAGVRAARVRVAARDRQRNASRRRVRDVGDDSALDVTTSTRRKTPDLVRRALVVRRAARRRTAGSASTARPGARRT